MNIDIALNTIFYIAIFIFPGIIFRKFYFRGNFTHQFSQGNLFERFIMTIFFSLVSILLSIGIILFFRYLGVDFLGAISYDTIIKTFNDIKKNEIPQDFRSNAFHFLTLMSLIYIISLLMGAILHSFVIKLGLDIRYPIFRFNHPWYYITNGKTIKEISSQKYLYTNIDILINDGYKKVMFSGVLLDILQNPLNNNIEHILVKNCYKYNFKDKDNSTQYDKKYISGNVMCFSKDNIINFNLTHITRDKNYKVLKYYILFIITLIFFGVLVFVCIFPWMENVFSNSFEIKGIFKKIVFTFSSIVISSLIYGVIYSYLYDEKRNKNKEKKTNGILYFITFIAALLWSIGIVTKWYYIPIVNFILIVVLAILEIIKTKDK